MSISDLGFTPNRILKRDLLGTVERGELRGRDGVPLAAVRRNLREARWWARPVATVLASRERRALRRLAGIDDVPQILGRARGELIRSWLPGEPLHDAAPPDGAWFAEARVLLARLHERGITHNDLHKEANWLVTPGGRPAIVDFQMASVTGGRGSWYRMLVREDLRHLLKHQRKYAPASLAPDDLALLARRSWIAAAWRRSVKPLYLVVTRRLLQWRDREGRGPRE
jgi:hypothetical protein